MKVTAVFREIFRFRKTNFSIVLLLTSLVIAAIAVLERQQYKFVLPKPSDDFKYKLLEDAWLDLQHITFTFHPYSSRANDEVHDYILRRVKELTKDKEEYIQTWDDYVNSTNILFKQPDVFNSSSTMSRVIYFESSNILVKILGSNPELPALLISAHFDSVPTSYGATDDGKGIASMLSLLQVYSQSQPERTIIFNFNNNEEFGLLGAHAFMNHPWSKEVKLFINLEGAGAGNRAILFRTSDTMTAKIYKDAVKSQPFGNSMYQQAFYKRLVSSETDYKVYENNGLRGWDIAFYKPRDYYHTIKDSIKYTSKESLWSMLHTSLQLAQYISSSEFELETASKPSIYFDVLGSYFFVIGAEKLFLINVILLIIGPLIMFLKVWLLNSRSKNGNSFWVSLRLPFSCIVSLSILHMLGSLIKVTNPFIYSRDYLRPFVGLFCLFLFSNYAVLSLLEHLYPSDNFKGTAIIQSFCFVWLLLVIFTTKLKNSGYIYTGIYPITIVYGAYILAIFFGDFRSAIKDNNDHRNAEVQSNYGTNNSSNQALETNESSGEEREAEITHNNDPESNEPLSNIDERAPLLRASSDTIEHKDINTSRQGLQYDWFIQYFCLVPISCYILFSCFLLALDALNQTIQESAAASRTVGNVVIISIFLVALPILPFVYKVNYASGLIFLCLGLTLLSSTLISQPFDELNPLKVRFSQTINLQNGSLPIVNIFTRKSFRINTMLSDLPSIKDTGAPVWCREINSDDSQVCNYIGEFPNLLNQTSHKSRQLMTTHILRDDRKNKERSPYAPMTAELKIDAPENRVCSIAFDSGLGERSSVKKIRVFESNKYRNSTTEKTIRLSEGINEFVIHKLSFEDSYHFEIEWFPKLLLGNDDGSYEPNGDDSLKLKITCYWGEYDTDSVVNGEIRRKVPAFDELLNYAPTNYIFTNRERGLVMVEDQVIL